MTISSPAGRRLAKAKADMDAANELFQIGETQGQHYAYLAARKELSKAAAIVADELVAQRFHLMEGD